MTQYVVGDIQGCYEPLAQGLEALGFDPEQDTLWCAGDLVNRGPDSRATLRLLKQLGASCRVVLGNHDLHLLAAYYGQRDMKARDTAREILEAADCDELILWLRNQPLIQRDDERQILMVHAGIPPIWTVDQSCQYAAEVETVVRSDTASRFFRHMYGDTPNCWSDELSEWERLRVITNYLTRMRFVGPCGELEFASKGDPDSPPDGFQPWFKYPNQLDHYQVLFGHWAALNGRTQDAQFVGLDTGCVWGGSLSFYSIDQGKLALSVSC